MIQGPILHSVSYFGSWGHALSVEEFVDKNADLATTESCLWPNAPISRFWIGTGRRGAGAGQDSKSAAFQRWS